MRSINALQRGVIRLIYDAFDKKKKKNSTVSSFVREGTRKCCQNVEEEVEKKKKSFEINSDERTADRLPAHNSVKVQERSGSLFVSNFLPFLALNEPDGNVKSRRFTVSSTSRKLKSPNGEATA